MIKPYVTIIGISFVLSALYINCAGEHTHLGFAGFSSEACEQPLLERFKKGYHKHFQKQCKSCHVTGPGMGNFADSNATLAFSSFISMGPERVHDKALDEGHNVPFTGPDHAPVLEPIQADWDVEYEKYESCMMALSEGNELLTLSEKPLVVSADWTALSWNLSTESDKKVAITGTFSIEARTVDEPNFARYEFRNPVINIENFSSNWSLDSIWFYLDGSLLDSTTTYSNLDVVIDSAPKELAPNAGSAYHYTQELTNTSQLSIQLRGLVSTSAAGGGAGGAGGGGGGGTDHNQITYTKLMAEGGIFRQSCVGCHSQANAQGGLDLTNYNALVSNYVRSGDAAGSVLFQRMNNANRPMPTSGLLPQAARDQVAKWINEGAAR